MKNGIDIKYNIKIDFMLILLIKARYCTGLEMGIIFTHPHLQQICS